MRAADRFPTLTSTVLCLFTSVVYPASFYRSAIVRRVGPTSIVAARIGGGRVSLLWHTHPATRATANWVATVAPVRERFFRANQRWRDAVRFGLEVESWRTSANAALVARTLTVPLWAPLLATAVLPAATAQRSVTRRRRARLGQCPGCGYDLRHAPAAGRCPECGRPFAGSAAVA